MEGSYVVKIKDIIRTLIMSREDFSDHDGRGLHEDSPSRPLHDKGCAFCEAWREALQLLDLDPRLIDFEAGDKVMLPGGIPGRVMGTDVTVRVEVQNGEHGPWAVGSFSPYDLTPREDEPVTYYRDRDQDLWKVTGKQTLSLCDLVRGVPLEGKCSGVWAYDYVNTNWGPLTPARKP